MAIVEYRIRNHRMKTFMADRTALIRYAQHVLGDITVRQLAGALGVTRMTLNRWERGEHPMGRRLVRKLAILLDIEAAIINELGAKHE
jgi:transcriptional regulator with XRE-family HTH domain